MSNKQSCTSKDKVALRREAEERLYDKARADSDQSLIDLNASRILHELQVHEVELELQNEELTRSRAELEIAADRYTDLYDFAPIAYFTLDQRGCVTQTNLAGASLLGKERAHLIDKRLSLFIVEENRQILSDFLKSTLADSAPSSIELQLFTEDNSARFVQMEAVISNDNSEYLTVMRDITKQKSDSIRISELEKRNRALLDYSPASHKVVDLEFKLRYMNRNGFSLLGIAEDEKWYGQPYPFDFFQDASKELMREKLGWVKQNKTMLSFECLARTINGEDVWLLHNLIPVLKDDATLDYITVVSADITQRKKQERQLANTQKVALVGQLSAGICHDLNNVLNIISGNAELIEMQGVSEQTRKYSNRIQEGILRAKSVTDRLLLLAKPKEESLSLINLDETITKELYFYEEALPKHINIIPSINSDAHILVDNHTFGDAVMNLVVNARNVMVDKGVIQISTQRVPDFNATSEYVHSQPRKAKEYAILSIKDNGIGISDEDLDKIFTPFFSNGKGQGGSGLGLAGVSAFVINNQCGLTVTSEVGKGAEFKLWLPIEETDVSKDKDAQIAHTSPLNKVNIVIVDDEKDLLEAFVDIFEISGARVSGFCDPVEAKTHIKEHPDEVDILLTDHSLGGDIKGSDLVKWVKKDYPSVNCFLMTGYSASKELSGISVDIIEKPVSYSELIKRLLS